MKRLSKRRLRVGLVGVVLAVVCLMAGGCGGVVDLTGSRLGPLPVCEIHHCSMRPGLIHVAGEIVYCPDYALVCREQFRNHGGHRYNGEREGAPWGRDVIDYVCYQCDAEYRLYWEKRKEKGMK